MKSGELNRVAVFAMAAVMMMGTTGCVKTSKKINDVASEGVVGTVVDAVTQKDITELKVHGMKIDAKEYAKKVSFENMANKEGKQWMDVYQPLMDEWDENGIQLDCMSAQPIWNLEWYKNKEFSDATVKNKEKYRCLSVEFFPQRKEDDLYGVFLCVNSPKISDDRDNFDFQIGSIATNKDTAKDYEKKSDFYPTLGAALHADIFRTDMNNMADDEYGRSYIAIYLDGKCVDINDYKKETKEIINQYQEDKDADILRKTDIAAESAGIVWKKLRVNVAGVSSEMMLENPNIEKSTKEKFMEFETAGIALFRSLQKVQDGSAKEMVVVVAEENIGMMVKSQKSEKEIAHEKENMRLMYYYITK